MSNTSPSKVFELNDARDMSVQATASIVPNMIMPAVLGAHFMGTWVGEQRTFAKVAQLHCAANCVLNITHSNIDACQAGG